MESHIKNLRDHIEQAINKAGSVPDLARELDTTSSNIYSLSHKTGPLFSADNIIIIERIADYLGVPKISNLFDCQPNNNIGEKVKFIIDKVKEDGIYHLERKISEFKTILRKIGSIELLDEILYEVKIYDKL